MPRNLLLAIKLVATTATLAVIIRQVNWSEVQAIWQRCHPSWLVVAFLAFHGSKITAAMRLDRLLLGCGHRIDFRWHVLLCYGSMFYSNLLPGAVSGDAYKALVFNKHFGVPMKEAVVAIGLDRITGLLLLGFLGACCLGFVWHWTLSLGCLVGMLLFTFCFSALIYYYSRDFYLGLAGAYWDSLVVQSLQILCATAILGAIGDFQALAAYLCVFVCATTAAVLPLTLGGIGIREVVALQLTSLLGLDPQRGFALMFMFYLISLVGSLCGLPVVIATRWPTASPRIREV